MVNGRCNLRKESPVSAKAFPVSDGTAAEPEPDCTVDLFHSIKVNKWIKSTRRSHHTEGSYFVRRNERDAAIVIF